MSSRYTSCPDPVLLLVNDAAAGICDGTYIIDGVPTVLTPADDWVYYQPQPADVATLGIYHATFRVYDPVAQKSATFPPKDRIEVQIGPDLA